MKNDREYRAFSIKADGEEKRVQGYATTFDQAYTLYEDEEYSIREVMSADAFDETDMEDVILQYNHEGHVYARRKNGTLDVTVDKPNGLYINADLGGTEIGSQLYEEIQGGYTDKMSIGFTVDRSADVWTREVLEGRTIETRYINKVTKLYDVSAVSIPANGNTSIEAVSVRALVDGVIDEIKAERLEAEKLEAERLKTEIRARL